MSQLNNIWDRLILRLPLLGRVVHLSELSRLCRSMSLLFRSGLPLTEILPLLIQSSRNRALSTALIQPVMTLTIGMIIAAIALSLVSAMYSIYGQGF